MKRKAVQQEVSPHQRREILAADVEAFLRAGNKIDRIPSGISGQDPRGSSPYRPSQKTNSTTK